MLKTTNPYICSYIKFTSIHAQGWMARLSLMAMHSQAAQHSLSLGGPELALKGLGFMVCGLGFRVSVEDSGLRV